MKLHHMALLVAWSATAGLAVAAGDDKVVPLTDTSVDGRLQRVAYLLTLSDEQLTALVPVQSGAYVGDCPNCDAGTQDYMPWVWTAKQPDIMTCPECAQTYPNNPKYPDDGMLKVAAPEGEHEYPYYTHPDGHKIFFRAIRDYRARRVMEIHCQDMAELWWITKEDDYARRATIIMHRFAQVYPGYAHTMAWPFRENRFSPWNNPHIEGVSEGMTSKGGTWNYATLDISRELVAAYDCLRYWPRLDDEARIAIENNLLGAMVRYAASKEDDYGNMSPSMWQDFTSVGRVLNQSEWIHEAMRRIDYFMRTKFLYDGYWCEPSPSYNGQVYWNVKIAIDALPPKIPGDLQSIVERNAVAMRVLGHFNGDLVYPNGKLMTLSDTWSTGGRSVPSNAAPTLVPGLGVAIFRSDSHFAWLNFAPGRGHAHRDALAIGLWAHGKELLRDIGYTHVAWRAWTGQTQSHNTVVVNGIGSDYDTDHRYTQLRAYATDGDVFHIADVDAGAAYRDVTSRYRRTVAWIGQGADGGYMIDIFQIHGGKQHDYLLHGSADEDSVATLQGVTLSPYNGTLLNDGVAFTYPTAESSGWQPQLGFGYFTDLQHGEASDAVTLDLRLAATPNVGTRTILLCEPDTTVYTGQTPRIREAGRNDTRLPDFSAPSFSARRSGDDLHSTFIAVHEPINGDSTIANIAAKRFDDAVLVMVDRHDGGRDYFACALDQPATIRDGAFRFAGRYGWLRTRDGRVEQARLVAGQSIALGDATLTATPGSGWSGMVIQHGHTATVESRGWFDVTQAIPPDTTTGALLLTFSDGTVRGFNVVRIEPRDSGTRLHVREAPGFDIADGQINLTSFPQRTIEDSALRYDLAVIDN
jgi:hypothetical protein